MTRYRCKLCGYIYSPLRGEPHNGIPAGTAFVDLPDDYVCPICGRDGKGRIGKWGFDEWRPTRYICSMCNYVYNEKRGEPHRGIKPGTKSEDLPDDYVCPSAPLTPRSEFSSARSSSRDSNPSIFNTNPDFLIIFPVYRKPYTYLTPVFYGKTHDLITFHIHALIVIRTFQRRGTV